jgi:hypothetical protein
MRVSIKYDEQAAGIITSRTDIYQVWTIEFSDEEKAIIEHRRLDKVSIRNMWLYPRLVSPIIREVPLPSKLPVIGVFFLRPALQVTVAELLLHRVFIYKWSTAAAAKDFEEEISGNLQALKEMIVENKDVGRDHVFEL